MKRAGLLSTLDVDHTVYYSSSADDATIYMEGRFKEGLSEVLGYLEQIKLTLLLLLPNHLPISPLPVAASAGRGLVLFHSKYSTLDHWSV